MQKSLDEIREFLKAAPAAGSARRRSSNSTLRPRRRAGQRAGQGTDHLVEVSDYHCPFCRRHVQQTQPPSTRSYVTPARSVTCSSTIRSRSCTRRATVARRRELRRRSGQVLELHARLFRQRRAKTRRAADRGWPGAGLDAAAFRACLDSGKHAKEVQDEREQIAKLSVNGTPMFLRRRRTVRRARADRTSRRSIEEARSRSRRSRRRSTNSTRRVASSSQSPDAFPTIQLAGPERSAAAASRAGTAST